MYMEKKHGFNKQGYHPLDDHHNIIIEYVRIIFVGCKYYVYPCIQYLCVLYSSYYTCMHALYTYMLYLYDDMYKLEKGIAPMN